MPAFHVHLNGKKVSTIGLDKSGVLTAIVNWIGRNQDDALAKQALREGGEFQLSLGGLDTSTKPDEHLTWAVRRLKVGDVVSIHLVKDARVSRPRARRPVDSVVDLQAQKKYVKMMAKKLGWKIRTR